MRIAVATDDQNHLAEHFGGSTFVLVATIEDGRISSKEIRTKPGHGTYSEEESHPQTDDTGRHGFGSEADSRHSAMFDVFKDCEVLIVNRIGTGAFHYFTSSGVRVIATDIQDIDETIAAYVKGKLEHIPSHMD